MSKPELRKRLAALSFSEKIKILEKLRARSLTIAASRSKLRSPGSDASDLPVKRGLRSTEPRTKDQA
jgi:hypothetical protein